MILYADSPIQERALVVFVGLGVGRGTITVAEPRLTGQPHDRSPRQHRLEGNDRSRCDPPAAHLTGQLCCTQLLDFRKDLLRVLITKFSFRLEQLENDSVQPRIDTGRRWWRPLPSFVERT